ncbi:unnamed protein product [Urochloa humidicola]
MANLAHKCNAPIMHLRLGELQLVVISSADAAKEVLKTHDATFATRAMSLTVKATIGDRLGLFFLPYGAKWRELRKICTIELLSTHRVRSFRPIREDEAARLVSNIASLLPSGQVNLSECVARFVTDSALRAIMGEHFQWREEFLETVAMTYKKATGFRIGDLFPSSSIMRTLSGTVREAKQYNAKLFELVDRAIVQHEERKMGAVLTDNNRKTLDLLDVLLSILEEDDPGCSLTIASIKAVILDIFVAGSTGTSALIQWAMLELMRNPGVLHKAQLEIRHVMQGKPKVTEDDLTALKYMKLVIKETLRLHPAPPLPLPKECQESCKILGYDVPRGTIVFVNSWAIGRDPIYWDEPGVFMPERFDGSTIDFKGTDFGFIPFGAGRRVCPGIMFAYAHIELVLATLLYHFDWHLPPGVTPDMVDLTEEISLDASPKTILYLHPVLRVSPEGSL